MKKNIIALAIASAVAAPLAAQAAPTVYGQLNVNLNQTESAGSDNGMAIGNVASRLGVKGSDDLGNGLKAVYKVEFALSGVGSGGSGSTLANRNQYLGLAGGFGTVLMGRHDTPMKMSQPSDIFNDGAADAGKYAGGLGFGGKGAETRNDQTLMYVSPSFSGVKLALAGYALATGKDSSITNMISAAAMYGSKKKGVYAALAYNSIGDKATTGADSATELRVSAQYKKAGLIVNGMYQDFSGDNSGIVQG